MKKLLSCSLLAGLAMCATSPARADKVDDLIDSAIHDPGEHVRVQSLRMLDRIASRRGIAAMLRALKDPAIAVRVIAVDGARRFSGERDVRDAVAALASDSSPLVRDHVEKALAHAKALSERPPPPIAIDLIAATASVPAPPSLVDRLRELANAALHDTPGIVPLASRPYGFQLESVLSELSVQKSPTEVKVTCAVTYTPKRFPSRARLPSFSGMQTEIVPIAEWSDTRRQSAQSAALAGAVLKAHEELIAILHVGDRVK